MSLRVRLQVWITALVGVIVAALSAVYLAQVAEARFSNAGEIAEINAQQIRTLVSEVTAQRMAEIIPPPATADEAIAAFVEIVELEPEVDELLASSLGSTGAIAEALVTGPNDRILAASLQGRQGQPHKPLPQFEEFESKGVFAQLNEVFGENQDYEVVSELGLEGGRRVFTVRIILSTALVRNDLNDELREVISLSVGALLISMLAAVFVSRLAVKPFERIGEMIDRIARGEASEDVLAGRGDAKEVAAVESKLSLLGERFRGAKDDADQLRGDIGNLLSRLEEAVLLFDANERLVMAGGAAERLLPGGRWGSIGRTIEDVFPESTELGAIVQSAVKLRQPVRTKSARMLKADGARLRVQVSVEIGEQLGSNQIAGSLVTLREADPRRQIRSQLDISTRLAAISRLTSGAAHEIKNPLNAINLHVEILKSKLEGQNLGEHEIEVISREIRRLDRVVKSFLDFTRPVELDTEVMDLAALLRELATLTEPDAIAAGVRMSVGELPDDARARLDRDLIKQALLNVIVNGIQAMAGKGGELLIALEQSGPNWLIRVGDQGAGIPEEIRDQIYQLYFTTKGKGSGIGLAMTFQIVQLHGGTIEFASKVGEGTEFRIELPAADPAPDRRPSVAAHAESESRV